jgi:hypothetical protein
VKQKLVALGFKVEDHAHSLNALRSGSQLSIQFTKDERYAGFPSRAEIRETLGLRLRVASLPDLVQAKIWAWSDPQHRLSKRKKTNSTSFAWQRSIRSSCRNCRKQFAVRLFEMRHSSVE